MYIAIVALTMVVLPLVSWGANLFLFPGGASGIVLLEVWFVFWAFGVRLLLAGIRQVLQPAFTAQHIFEISDEKSHVVVQELGFANVSLGVVGVLSLFLRDWILPASVLGCIFYGLAGINHIFKKKNGTEWIAMVSDLYASLALLSIFVAVILIK